MKYIENHEEDVEMMSVKEELKHFSPYASEGCSPQAQPSKQSNLPGHI